MRLLVKALLMGALLRLKIIMTEVRRKKLGWRYFCRFATGVLTLRPKNTYIYVCEALFGSFNFQATSCGFQKLEVS